MKGVYVGFRAAQVAWGWLWENIEGLLSSMLGKPKMQEEALERFFACLS